MESSLWLQLWLHLWWKSCLQATWIWWQSNQYVCINVCYCAAWCVISNLSTSYKFVVASPHVDNGYICTFKQLHVYLVIYTESAVLPNSAQYYGSWSYTETYYYSCSSSSTSLTGCNKHSVSSSQCNSDDQVGLWCMTLPQTGKYMYIILNTCTCMT